MKSNLYNLNASERNENNLEYKHESSQVNTINNANLNVEYMTGPDKRLPSRSQVLNSSFNNNLLTSKGNND